MKHKKLQKPIRVMTSSAIALTALLTPIAYNSSPSVQAASTSPASSPIYTAPSYVPMEIFDKFTGGNIYINYAYIDRGKLYLDMTKVYKSYGFKVTMPSQRVVTKMKTVKTGEAEWLVTPILPSDKVYGAGSGRYILIETLNTKGNVFLKSDRIFPMNYYGPYDLGFGQAVYNLFGDSMFNILSPGVTQDSIDKVRSMSSRVENSDEKTRLLKLISKAEQLLKQEQTKDLADAKDKVEGLYTGGEFDTLKDTTNQAAIDDAQKAVDKLPNGAEKDRLQDLLKNAQNLLNKKEQAEKDLADVKNKVEDLFTDDKFDTLKDTTNQAAIDDAQKAVDKLPNGAEKDLADAKNEVEDLFTDDKYDTLKGSTDQGAIDEAEDAVSKLPAGPEKERLEDLLNNAQNLLNKKEQAEKDLNDAKNKVEGLFTDDKYDTLKGSTDQGAVDEAQEAVDKLPVGPEKDRLQDLVDKAEELLTKDVTPPEAPKLNTVTTTSKEVTGTGEAGAKVTVTIDGKTYTGVVGPDGKFAVGIPNQPVHAVITVTLTDAAGNVSNSSTVKVVQFMPNEPVKIDTVYQDAETVTGKAPEGANIVRLLLNGEALRTAPVNKDGTFSIYSKYVGVDENGKNKTLQPGDIVTVDYGVRTPWNLQAHTTVIKQQEKLQVNPVAPNADYVTGKSPEGTQNIRLIVNGIAQRTVSHTQTGAGFINPDGSYQIYSRFIVDEIGNSRRLHTGDIIEVDYGALVVGGEVAKTIVK